MWQGAAYGDHLHGLMVNNENYASNEFIKQYTVHKLIGIFIKTFMTHRAPRPLFVTRYARLVLGVFVLAVLNMSFQMPAHAFMQQRMQQSPMQMPDKAQLVELGDEMQHCKCPPAMCETVASYSDQGIEGISPVNFSHLLAFQPVYFSLVADAHHQPSTIVLNHHEWQYRQFSPPPLSLNTILHI